MRGDEAEVDERSGGAVSSPSGSTAVLPETTEAAWREAVAVLHPVGRYLAYVHQRSNGVFSPVLHDPQGYGPAAVPTERGVSWREGVAPPEDGFERFVALGFPNGVHAVMSMRADPAHERAVFRAVAGAPGDADARVLLERTVPLADAAAVRRVAQLAADTVVDVAASEAVNWSAWDADRAAATVRLQKEALDVLAAGVDTPLECIRQRMAAAEHAMIARADAAVVRIAARAAQALTGAAAATAAAYGAPLVTLTTRTQADWRRRTGEVCVELGVAGCRTGLLGQLRVAVYGYGERLVGSLRVPGLAEAARVSAAPISADAFFEAVANGVRHQASRALSAHREAVVEDVLATAAGVWLVRGAVSEDRRCALCVEGADQKIVRFVRPDGEARFPAAGPIPQAATPVAAPAPL